MLSQRKKVENKLNICLCNRLFNGIKYSNRIFYRIFIELFWPKDLLDIWNIHLNLEHKIENGKSTRQTRTKCTHTHTQRIIQPRKCMGCDKIMFALKVWTSTWTHGSTSNLGFSPIWKFQSMNISLTIDHHPESIEQDVWVSKNQQKLVSSFATEISMV